MRICKSLLLSSKSLSSLSSLISIKRYISIVNNNNNNYYNDYSTKLRSISTSSGKGFAEKIDNNNNINLIKPNSSDSNNNENNNRKKPEDWDLKGLKAETSRVYLRIFKKIGKASERLSKGKEFYNKNNNNLKELENYSNISELENELKILQDTLVKVTAPHQVWAAIFWMARL
jgi:hypothetical protein